MLVVCLRDKRFYFFHVHVFLLLNFIVNIHGKFQTNLAVHTLIQRMCTIFKTSCQPSTFSKKYFLCWHQNFQCLLCKLKILWIKSFSLKNSIKEYALLLCWCFLLKKDLYCHYVLCKYFMWNPYNVFAFYRSCGFNIFMTYTSLYCHFD